MDPAAAPGLFVVLVIVVALLLVVVWYSLDRHHCPGCDGSHRTPPKSSAPSLAPAGGGADIPLLNVRLRAAVAERTGLLEVCGPALSDSDLELVAESFLAMRASA